MTKRCPWAGEEPLYCQYHDEEWGVPVHDDRLWFEFILLEGAQAGLNWFTILQKREGYRQLFKNFDPKKVAKFTAADAERLRQDARIIRNRLKIQSAITNAQAFLEVQAEFGQFDDYIWRFTDGEVIQNRWRKMSEVPAETDISIQLSKDLKKRGFRFVGPTICYALMQATGMVNDHLQDCYRYQPLAAN